MTHDEMIAVIAAHRDGKKIQVKPAYRACEKWINCDPAWNFGEYDYRIAPEPKPPKYRPWRRDDIPRGGWVKNKKYEQEVQITGIFQNGVYLAGTGLVSFERMLEDWTYKGTPCGVEVQE